MRHFHVPNWHRRPMLWQGQGFPRLSSAHSGLTLMESLVVVVMVGVLAAIAAPSFLEWLTKYQINQAAVQVQAALEVSQQEAMRRGRTCSLYLPDGPEVSGDCLVTGTINFAPGVVMKSNLGDRQVRFGLRGNTTDGGTILIYADGSRQARCIVTSLGIGLIRTGTYMGDTNVFDPTQCQASS